MPIRVSRQIEIPDADLEVAFIRASGPGGQNVNKVASAVQLRFDLAGTAALAPRVKDRLRRLAGQRLTDDGAILVQARAHRSQGDNRREAEQRLADLIRQALPEPKVRRATKPTRASQERRLASKARAQRTKRLRGRVARDD
ncbi:MAG: Peptidyl-tRNA hydrolase ArfB [Steroidobacteraceae bacterium]|nr:Peptidyl-tRNA hydrolase ArfB [Steroidobacteraceae bacterium]